MFLENLKKKGILILIIFIFFVSSCTIKKRLQEKPIVTYIEKPAELLLQDANRYLLKKNYTLAAQTFEEIDKQHPYSKLAKKSKIDRKSTRLNSSHKPISYAVFCLKKKT